LALGWPKRKLGITYLFHVCELRELPRRYFTLILGGGLGFRVQWLDGKVTEGKWGRRVTTRPGPNVRVWGGRGILSHEGASICERTAGTFDSRRTTEDPDEHFPRMLLQDAG
jgi:hypothetical protein